jgi:hypothetical protein
VPEPVQLPWMRRCPQSVMPFAMEHGDDQLADRCRGWWSTLAAMFAVVPIVDYEPTMPGQQRGRGNRENSGPVPFRYQAGELREPQATRPGIPDPLDLPARHSILVTKDEQFSVLGCVMAHSHCQRTMKTTGSPEDTERITPRSWPTSNEGAGHAA